MQKLCKTCDTLKDIDRFSKRSNRPSGVQSKCKDCERVVRMKYYKPHEQIRRKLKISDELFEELQSITHCQCCGNFIEGKRCIDHCHTTMKLRGVLCHKCNTALGLVDDNVSTLKAMISYLNG